MFFYLLFSIYPIYFLLWVYFRYHFNYWQRRGIPHNRPTIPTGNMQEWLRTKHYAQIFCDTYDKFKGSGPYAGFYFNTQRAVIVLDTQLARRILDIHFTHFERRGLFHNEKDDPLTGNMFLLDGAEWSSLKAKMASTFTTLRMRRIQRTVIDVAEELERVFGEKVVESGDGIMNVSYLFTRFTADIIGTSVFGLECNTLRNPGFEFYVMVRKFFSKRRHSVLVDSLINCFPEWAKFLRMKIIPQDVTDFFLKTVKDTIKHRESRNIKKSDYLQMLIELKNQPGKQGKENLNWEEVAAQAFAFFVAGFDTCSTTMTYVFYELAKNQEIQDRLRLEILRILQTRKQKFTYECLHEMKYLDQVLSEALRKYPVCPALFRKCTKRYVPYDPDYYIEKGCTVIIPTLSFHHDPAYFPNPKKFDPERFAPSNMKNIRSFSYLPFGDGPRSCTGIHFARMLTKLGIVHMVRSYMFETCEETKLEIVLPSFNLHPMDIILKVTKI